MKSMSIKLHSAATVSFPDVVQEDVGSMDVCFNISGTYQIPHQGARISLRLIYPSIGLYSWDNEELYGGRHLRTKDGNNLQSH